MSTILFKASTAAHQAVLKQEGDSQRYSKFPVHDAAFWQSILAAAKVTKTAKAVIDAMEIIEAEPCIENERVWTNVRNARALARIALLN